MRVSECVGCSAFPCVDVKHACYTVPDIDLTPKDVSIVVISEAAPSNPLDRYYKGADSLFEQTTIQAFHEAGVEISSLMDAVEMGVYFTTAVKCAKTSYGIKAKTIDACSSLLEKELALFPRIRALMLMGDVAIKAVNRIAKRAGEERVIPAGSTYKIRGQEYFFRGIRVFPSYLQAGPSFFIEKSKRKMIAEDIAAAFSLLQ